MDRDRQHVVALPESLLYAVAVVRVEVDVGDTQPGMLGGDGIDCDCEIVVDAESGGSVVVRVVQTASRAEGAAW